MSELKEIFIEETKEHLAVLNESLLMLEKDPTNSDLINEIFRVTHTIKGSAAMMDLHKMSSLAHGMEDVLYDIRDGKIATDQKLLELLFVCEDYLENCLDSIVQSGDEDDFDFDQILINLHRLIEAKVEQNTQAPEVELAVDEKLVLNQSEYRKFTQANTPGLTAYQITICFSTSCIFPSIQTILIHRSLEQLGDIIKAVPGVAEVKEKNYHQEPKIIKAVVVTSQTKKELQKKLKVGSEAELVLIEPFQPKLPSVSTMNPLRLAVVSPAESTLDGKELPVNQIVAQIIEDPISGTVAVDQKFFRDFIAETTALIEKINLDLLELEGNHHDDRIIRRLFRAFHTIRGLAGFLDFEPVEQLASVTETFLNGIRNQEIQVSRNCIDLILGSGEFIKKMAADYAIAKNEAFMASMKEHLRRLAEKELEDSGLIAVDATEANVYQGAALGEILVGECVMNPVDLEHLLTKQKQEYTDLKLGQVAIKEKKAEPREIIQTIRLQEDTKKMAANSQAANEFMRVPVSRVDSLADLVGELLILHSQIEQDAWQKVDSNDPLLNHIGRMERIIKDLQIQSMSLRMVSLKATFQKINRIARDTINQLGKNVDFETHGDDTEIDRGVAEKIQDPLLHIVKNAISHGIEPEAERLAKKKSAQGKVRVSAYSKKGAVYIEVADDGSGLSLAKIRAKAFEKHLLDPNRDYADHEVIDCIFLPGFSTAATVNQVSGRGVGLDVVRTEMNRIGGKVAIVNLPDQGCTFILQIPINYTAMNGMIINISGNRFIVPTLNIREIIQTAEQDWVFFKGQRVMYRRREQVIPVLPAAAIFDLEGGAEQEKFKLLIMLEYEGRFRMLPVTDIIGRKEVVVKPMLDELRQVRFASGISILGDGKASLILDIPNLFLVNEEKVQATAQ